MLNLALVAIEIPNLTSCNGYGVKLDSTTFYKQVKKSFFANFILPKNTLQEKNCLSIVTDIEIRQSHLYKKNLINQ